MERTITGVVNLFSVVAPRTAEEIENTRRMTMLKTAASDTLEAILGPAPLVLIVDDDAEYRKVLMEYLNSTEMCRPVAVPSAAQALAMLSRETVRMVITDLHMPVMDGAALLRVVATRWPDVIRVLVSGSEGASVPVKIADEFIRKQTSLLDTTDVVLRLLQGGPGLR